jgi:hypothetical protein
VLCVYQARSPGDIDHSSTPYDDGDANRWFTHIELRNASPFPVDLSRGNWRISVLRQGASSAYRLPTPRRFTTQLRTSLIFKKNLSVGAPDSNEIAGGGLMVIGSMGRDDGGIDTFNDTNYDETFYRLSPMVPEGTVPQKQTDAPPGCSLDLNHNSHYGKNYWQLIDYMGGTQDVTNNPAFRGGFLRGSDQPGPNALDPQQRITILLERRVHTGRNSPANIDAAYDDSNPWITVDEFQIQTAQQLSIDANDTDLPGPQLRTRVLQLQSRERTIPLVRSLTGNEDPSDGPLVYPTAVHPPEIRNGDSGLLRNTCGVINLGRVTINPQRFQRVQSTRVWQPHFDRPFSSVTDLLQLPLYGPHQTTARLAGQNNQLLLEIPDGMGSQVSAPSPIACVAAAKFLQPTHPTDVATVNWSPHNRWFRVLELLEIRPMDQETLLTQRPELWSEMLTRTPGRLQLNALPHGDNLFALLDDPGIFRLQPQAPNPSSVVDLREPGRNWWFELLRTRDGVDPLLKQFTTGEPVILPGAPSSRPFRGLSHALSQVQGNLAATVLPETTEHGLLRRLGLDASLGLNLPIDTRTATNFGQPNQAYRRLFEARSLQDKTVGEVDLPARNRLLGKVANNSTNRGHVFMVWMTVGFFDAIFPDPQNPALVQVGAELEDQARRRGFFVVDRSLLEEAYIPPQMGSNGQPIPGTFDFRKFVQYRRTMQ